MSQNTLHVNWKRVGIVGTILVVVIAVAVFILISQSKSSPAPEVETGSGTADVSDAEVDQNFAGDVAGDAADDAAEHGSANGSTDASGQGDAEKESDGGSTPGKITVLAMGDMLPHDTVHANAGAPENPDYGQFFAGISEQLDGADAIFCNQEVPSAGEEFGITGYPVFNAPQQFARDLRETAGCDLINLANNHTADVGTQGIAATRAVWDDLDPVSISGANRSSEEQNQIVYGDIKGIKTALVSFAEYSNLEIDSTSLNLMGDTDLVQRLLTEARQQADLVIVSAHWGTEDSHTVNDAQRSYAQMFADYGVDVVIGTGPHVLQPVEWIDRADGGRTLVWYSIGNMLSTQLTLEQRTGIIASFDVELAAGGDSARGALASPVTVTDPGGVLTYMHYDWSPEQEAAGDLLARHNLSITPLASSDELLERTRFGVNANDWTAAQSNILGNEVMLSDE